MNMKKLTSIICGAIILGTTFLFSGCGSESMVNQNNNIENIASEHVYSHDELLAAINDYSDGTIIVVETGGVQLGLLVDEILGQQQIVIKSLGEVLKGVPGIAGGAIMPDGKVGLILDIGGIVKLAEEILTPI